VFPGVFQVTEGRRDWTAEMLVAKGKSKTLNPGLTATRLI